MKTLSDHLSQYAAYHRDRRNIATHLVGIPMIVVALAALGSRPAALVAGLPLSPAVAVTLAVLAFYFALDLRFGVVMTALLALALWAGAWLAAQSTGVWLGGAIGLFVVGWVFQFVGHAFEGRKPAFLDDVRGLLVGPLFVVAEVGFAVGLRAGLREAIEIRVGPTRVRRPPALWRRGLGR
jgi:uncharacterized membrane protein YGL010W